MTRLSVTEVRRHVQAALARVAGGERLEITRRGQVVAVLVSPREARLYRRTAVLKVAAVLQARWQADRAAMAAGERRPLGTLDPGYAQELVEHIRWQRDR